MSKEMTGIDMTYQGQDLTEPVMALLRSDQQMHFRIDIETDSTVQPDAEAQKAEAVELMGAVTRFMEQAAIVGREAPETIPMSMELMKFSLRRFKISRTLEETIDRTAQAIIQRTQQAQQNQQPSEAQVEAQTTMGKAQLDARTKIATAEIAANADRDVARIREGGEAERQVIRAVTGT